ncbi:DUF294 nucleotidyltransferase-like domain-containing protein [Desulfoscipio gibsoniae]|uniref:DUF294 nucleotidyltransferase-like domain-containing protein n=1 Tax=Desulfoscipio gibsoniae TaxID=102134 RepID=UPI0012FF523C|nr:DUF294 nucleotidyltransferase-like domain-containing protein [Desulfoscipio gibsoniae]
MNIFNTTELLEKIHPFNELPGSLLGDVVKQVRVKTFPKGAYIFRQGEAGRGYLYFISRGSAEVLVENEKGTVSVVSHRHEQDFFGETVFMTEKNYPGSVRAREEMTCVLVPNTVFEHLIDKQPGFAKHFIKVTTNRMRSLYEELVEGQSADTELFTETPVFRRRLGEIMVSPVITCKADETVHSVAQTMKDHGISSVIIVDGDNRPIGLLTERDLVRRVLVQGADYRPDLPARKAMNPKLVVVTVNDFFYEALLVLVKNQATHLVVMDEDKLVGIISLRHMIKTRSTGTLWLSDKVRELSSKKDLPSAGQEIDSFLNGLVAEKASINEIFEIMANIHDRLTRRILKLCEEEMIREGYGPPPVDYCWFEMGSSGRKEQALRTDQDNGIIYETVPPEYSDLAMTYFLRLGNKVVDWLALSGFKRCKGNVMANNPDWCMALDKWEELVEAWTRRGRPEDIRKLTIFLDFRGIYGKLSLAARLREHAMRTVGPSKYIINLLIEDGTGYRVPLNLWGGFMTEKSGPNRGGINLKNSACIHLVNCLRIFSLRYDIRETPTLARLAALVQLDIIPQGDGEYFEAAYQTLMHLRLLENLKKVKENKAPDNFIDPRRLSKREQGMLKDAFQAITRLQKITSTYLGWPLLR